MQFHDNHANSPGQAAGESSANLKLLAPTPTGLQELLVSGKYPPNAAGRWPCGDRHFLHPGHPRFEPQSDRHPQDHRTTTP